MTRVLRFDAGTLQKPRKTSQGYLRVDGWAARVGIQEYRNPDGSIRKELREDSAVFDQEALSGFEGVPVTDDHPTQMVDIHNTKALTKGTVLSVGRRDGDHVAVSLVITDPDLIKKMESGKRQLSTGYYVELDETPGVHPQYGRYDAKQVRVGPVNHLAVVDRGRAGTASVRMDAAVDVRMDEVPDEVVARLDAIAERIAKLDHGDHDQSTHGGGGGGGDSDKVLYKGVMVSKAFAKEREGRDARRAAKHAKMNEEITFVRNEREAFKDTVGKLSGDQRKEYEALHAEAEKAMEDAHHHGSESTWHEEEGDGADRGPELTDEDYADWDANPERLEDEPHPRDHIARVSWHREKMNEGHAKELTARKRMSEIRTQSVDPVAKHVAAGKEPTGKDFDDLVKHHGLEKANKIADQVKDALKSKPKAKEVSGAAKDKFMKNERAKDDRKVAKKRGSGYTVDGDDTAQDLQVAKDMPESIIMNLDDALARIKELEAKLDAFPPPAEAPAGPECESCGEPMAEGHKCAPKMDADDLARLEGERDAARTAAEEAKAELDKVRKDAADSVTQKVREALDVLSKAVMVLGKGSKIKLDGKDVELIDAPLRAVKCAVIKHLKGKTVSAEKLDAYVDALFDDAVESYNPAAKSLAAAKAVVEDNARKDSTESAPAVHTDPEKAAADKLKNSLSSAWMTAPDTK